MLCQHLFEAFQGVAFFSDNNSGFRAELSVSKRHRPCKECGKSGWIAVKFFRKEKHGIDTSHLCIDRNWHLPGGSRIKDRDRKSTRLNSSHVAISYDVFFLEKKKNSIIKSE